MRHTLIFFIIFVAGALAVSYPGLSAPMLFDSVRLQLLEEFDHQIGVRDFIGLGPNRAFSMLTFYLNYALTGMDPLFFRLFNMVVLAATALMMVGIMLLLFEVSGVTDRALPTERKFVAAALGLAFAVHPANTSLALYIWQRQALLASFFYCAAFLVYIASRMERLTWGWKGYALSFCLFACAALSKETALTLPLVIVLAEVAFFKTGVRGVAKLSAGIFLFLAMLLGMKSVLEWLLIGYATPENLLRTIEDFRVFSTLNTWEILLTLSRVIFSHYLSMIVLPLPSSVRVLDATLISRSILNPVGTLPAVVAVLALAAGSLVFLRRRPLAAFGILFFLINISFEPLLEPQFLVMGHRVNLPMLGILLAVADGLFAVINWAHHRLGSARIVFRLAILFLLPIVWLGMVSHLRAEIWSNSLFFWRDTVRGLPAIGPDIERANYFIALGSLGREMKKVGRYDEAIELYERALNLWPNSDRAYLNLADALAITGRTSEAVTAYKKVLELEPNDAGAHFNLAATLLQSGNRDDATKHLRKAVEIRPRFARAHYRLGKVLMDSGEASNGQEHLRRALQLDPGIASR
jgi:protein O-mannosyl-transferase